MEVILDNEIVNVIINRKKIKNIYLRFDDNLNLVINANKYTTNKEILRLIAKNQESLTNMFLKVQKKKKKSTEFWYLGSSYQIIYDEKAKEVTFDKESIIVKNEETLNKFIKNKTKEIFTYEVEELKKIIPTPPFILKFRKMKTRWGVCNYKTMTITLNTELIRYKKEDLRYVIVHEMCHFHHHDHSKDFWQMVAKYYPEYKKTRKELKE